MAKIPQYVSSLTPTAETGQVMIDPNNVGQTGKDLQVAAQGADQLGGEMQKISGITQLTQANNYAQENLRNVRAQALSDPDLWKNQQKYTDQINKIHTDSLGMVNDNLYKAELDRRLGTTVAVNNFDVKQYARKNLIDTSKASMLNTISSLSDTYVQASNPLQRQDTVNQINQTIEDQVNSGLMHAADAVKFKVTTMKNLMDKQVTHDIDVDPNIALKNLQDGAYGDLPYGDKTKYMSISQQMIERTARVAKLQQDQVHTTNENKMIDDMTGPNAPRTPDIETALVTNNVSNQFGQYALKAASSPKTVDATTDAETYNKIVNKFVDAKSSTSKIQTLIMKGMSEGNLATEDVQSLNKMQSIQMDPVAKQQFTTGLMMIGNAADKLSPSDDDMKHQMTRDYLYRTLNGESPAAATHSVYKDAVYKQFPSVGLQDKLPAKVATASQGVTSLLPQTDGMPKAGYQIKDGKVSAKGASESKSAKTGGRLMVDGKGIKAMVYPDGSFEEVN